MISLKFEGGAELLRNLDQLSARVSRRVQSQALKEAAEPMRQRMSELAPHRPPAPDLRDNIVISPARGADSKEVAVAVGPSKRFFYGGFNEFGTSRQAARPFARPAFDEVAPRSLEIIRSELWDALKSRGLGLFTRDNVSVPVSGEEV